MVLPLYRTVRIFHLHVERPLGDRLGYRSLSRRDWALGDAVSFFAIVSACRKTTYTHSQNGRRRSWDRTETGRLCPIPGRVRRRAAAVPARKRVLTPHHIKAAKSGVRAHCERSQTKAGQELGAVSASPRHPALRAFGRAQGRRSPACSLDFRERRNFYTSSRGVPAMFRSGCGTGMSQRRARRASRRNCAVKNEWCARGP